MEEQEGKKIIKINLLQASMTLGTTLGLYLILTYVITVLSLKYSLLSFLLMPLVIGIPVVAYLLVRRFRDSNQLPFFPFPISWILSVLMFLFASVLSCMTAYLYLRFIDQGALSASLMAYTEQFLQSMNESIAALTDPVKIEQMNNYIEMMRQTVTWFCSLPASGVTKQLIQTSLMWGNILSLIIGLITTKRLKLIQ
jgi:hypothetical protein